MVGRKNGAIQTGVEFFKPKPQRVPVYLRAGLGRPAAHAFLGHASCSRFAGPVKLYEYQLKARDNFGMHLPRLGMYTCSPMHLDCQIPFDGSHHEWLYIFSPSLSNSSPQLQSRSSAALLLFSSLLSLAPLCTATSMLQSQS